MSIQLPIIGAESYPAGFLGRIVRSAWTSVILGLLDAEGPTEQSTVIAIGGAENSSDYSIRVQSSTGNTVIDETVTVTTDASATVAELRDLLSDALLANPTILAVLEYPVLATAQITLNAKPGRAFSVTFPDNPTTDLVATTTAASAAPSYLYGQAVERVDALSGQPAVSANGGAQRPAAAAASGATLVVTLATNANTETSVLPLIHTPSGAAPSLAPLSTTAGASAAATTAALVAAAEARFPDATVEITVADSEVTITFPPGDTIGIGTPTNSGSLDVTYAATAGSLPSFGIVYDERATAPLETRSGLSTVLGPDAGSGLAVIVPGDGSTEVAVYATGSSYTRGGAVYVGTDGAERGLLYAASSSTRVPFTGAKWVGLDPNDSTIAILAL